MWYITYAWRKPGELNYTFDDICTKEHPLDWLVSRRKKIRERDDKDYYVLYLVLAVKLPTDEHEIKDYSNM